MKAPINSLKHYLQNTLATVAAGAVGITTVAHAVEAVTTGAEQVRIGALVKAIFIEDWVRTSDTAAGSFVFAIVKLVANAASPTAAQMANLHDYTNKSNVIYVTQGLSNDQDTVAIPMTKGWYKIPKGMQRMALGDKWVTALFAQALDQNHCGCAVFKEYY